MQVRIYLITTAVPCTNHQRPCELGLWHSHTALGFCLPADRLIAVRSSSVSLPHFSFTLPFNCFQFPSTRFQSIVFSCWFKSPLESAMRRTFHERSVNYCWLGFIVPN